MIHRILPLIPVLAGLSTFLSPVHAETPKGGSPVGSDETFLGMDAMIREEGEERVMDETDFYQRPTSEALPFDPSAISLSAGQTSLLVRALNAVACNYPSGRGAGQVPVPVKQMALALVLRLDSHNQDARLAEYQLRRNRAPRPLGESESRETLAARLWNAGFGLHRYTKSPDDTTLAACLLDLAARFQPDDTEQQAAMAALALPDADTRWEEVTEIPDLDPLVSRQGPVVTEPVAPVVPALSVPEAFAFHATEASLALFTPTNGDRFPRLGVQLVTDRSQLPEQIKRSNQPLGLDADFPGYDFSKDATRAMGYALARIDQRLPEWRGTKGFLHYTLQSPFSPESERSVGPAAVVLAQLLARGKAPDPSFAIAGSLAEDGSLSFAPGLVETISSTTESAISLVALPAEAEAYLGDLALLGNLEPLLARQYLSCATLDDLVALAPKERPLALATALETFGDIQSLAARMLPAEIIANRHVQERLRDIVAAAPQHLSARFLLAAALDRTPSTLSLTGSVSQLRAVEQPLRALISQRLNPTPLAPAPDFAQASALFSKSDFDLRKLRPVLHNDARPFADSLVHLIDDLRVQIRADAARSAVFLQEALDSLEFQVAQFADDA
jgi:hypothetical protein